MEWTFLSDNGKYGSVRKQLPYKTSRRIRKESCVPRTDFDGIESVAPNLKQRCFQSKMKNALSPQMPERDLKGNLKQKILNNFANLLYEIPFDVFNRSKEKYF